MRWSSNEQTQKVVAQHMHTTQQANAELHNLVLEVMVLVGESPADWQYHVDTALAEPVDAMTCYTTLKSELQPR